MLLTVAAMGLFNLHVTEWKPPKMPEFAGVYACSGGFAGETLVLKRDGACSEEIFTDVVMPEEERERKNSGTWKFDKDAVLVRYQTKKQQITRRFVPVRWANYYVLVTATETASFIDNLEEERKELNKESPFMVGRPLSMYMHRDLPASKRTNWNLIQVPKSFVATFKKALGKAVTPSATMNP